MDLLEDDEEEEEAGLEDDEEEPYYTRPLQCESPMDIFGSSPDISPCPSASSSLAEDWRPQQPAAAAAADSSAGSFPAFFSKFESEDWMAEGDSDGKMGTLSLDDIADSSFFDINRHLDAEILSTDLFPS
jgi:hypothetical protein